MTDFGHHTAVVEPHHASASIFEEFLELWSRRDFVRRLGGGLAFSLFMAGGIELLEACGQSPSSQRALEKVVKGGHLVEGAIGDITQLNPILGLGFTTNIYVINMLFDGLVAGKVDGTFIPLLAAELPKISDGTTYTFKLRDGVKFTDGHPLTSEDVVWTYNLSLLPEYKAFPSSRRGDFETYVESISAPDPLTVVVKLKKPYGPFLTYNGQFGIMPKHVLGGMDASQLNSAAYNSAPTVTSGQFKFVKWEKSQQLVLARNDAYWGPKANVDTYVRRVIADNVALASALKTGEVDFGLVSPSVYDAVKVANNLAVTTYPSTSVAWYGHNLNPEHGAYKFFGDKRVRQALLYALDRKKLVEAIYFGQGLVAEDFWIPSSWAYNPNVKPKYTYDRKKAEEMLDAAGWKKGASGVREKGGVPFAVTLSTTNSNKEYQLVAQALQDQWKSIGVQLELKISNIAQLINVFEYTHDFDLVALTVTWGADPDEALLWHSRNTKQGGFNGFLFKSQEVDRLLDEATSETDRNRRKQLYFKLQDIINEELPAVPLVIPKIIVSYSKRVRNVNVGVNTLPWLREAWVTDGK